MFRFIWSQDELFSPTDFFARRSMPAVYLMIDLRCLGPDTAPEIDYDHGVAPDAIDSLAPEDNNTLPRDDCDDTVIEEEPSRPGLVSFDLLVCVCVCLRVLMLVCVSSCVSDGKCWLYPFRHCYTALLTAVEPLSFACVTRHVLG